ncbi:HU family DNA-binding protein [Ornithobacterium rhinotracheale]|uniref:HU family DNA-binding protein n=1 Tax=Ornithobacterium rhinotracheale TaxID=28251 RepID=UPI0004F88A0E|nr:HU family DNA-binding protein [Ornithobacterium rhinotracheale]AIP99267.1 DNA-binding protein [Ornithobacterium rhinotracheale ORT-UMN 88]KGB67121.1 DNA-binding protein [Ornithobacterium rhinotracheale H06-030791]MCK0194300.1 HU family DNA-binding protein [Ornithobacterium rhinotracheale]MCK0199831.1 HU family DNA-binding protein [Ornithobacterium rhinotracheale]MCK0202396.1 HU family DNA-binding protein [Ornithobacterium rhinotracheale]
MKTGTTEQRALAKNIADKSSLTVGDIANVIENLLEELPKELVEGKSVKLGEFGTFRLSLSSEGAATEKDFNVGMIKTPKVIFTPGVSLKKALSNIKFEKE